MAINDLTESSHLARVIMDIFPECGVDNAIRLARAIRTMIIITNAEVEEKLTAPIIPEGWTPASEQPNLLDSMWCKTVEIMLEDKSTCYGWHGYINWRMIGRTFVEEMRNPEYKGANEQIKLPVLCWRELPPPAPKPLAVGDTFTVTFTVAKDGTWFNVALGHIPALSKSGLNYGIKLSDIDGQEVAK